MTKQADPTSTTSEWEGTYKPEAAKIFAEVSTFMVENLAKKTDSTEATDKLLELRQQWFDFIASLLAEERRKYSQDILKWAEKEVGRRCAKTDFLYMHLKYLLERDGK